MAEVEEISPRAVRIAQANGRSGYGVPSRTRPPSMIGTERVSICLKFDWLGLTARFVLVASYEDFSLMLMEG